MINFSCNNLVSPVKMTNIFKPSFKAVATASDTFVPSLETMKKSWIYSNPKNNPMIRQEFEKLFASDSHYMHDGHNGKWYISDVRKGNETTYFAAEGHPKRIKEIRVFGKKGNIVKNAGTVAKLAQLKFNKNSNTYVSQPINVKTKDGVKPALMHYIWVEEQSKMFLDSIKVQ